MLAGLVLSAAFALSPAAQTLPPASRAEPPTEVVARAFSRLFPAPAGGQRPPAVVPVPPPQPEARPRPRTKVVCGMTVVIVDGESDAPMLKTPPREGVIFPMRRVPPRVCGQ
jgi:hypothetical protein